MHVWCLASDGCAARLTSHTAVATISLRAGSRPASANVLDLANKATFDCKEAVTSVATGFALS
jgi:hypothetical protein